MIRTKIIKQLVNSSEIANEKGYLNHFTDNLISTIILDDFKTDLENGDGNELYGKFQALHSSSALGVNFFGFFKRNLDKFTVFGEKDFNVNAQFEKKLPTGMSRPPNLDFYLENENYVIGFESKFLETLSRKKPEISKAYSDELLSIVDEGFKNIISHYRKNNEKSYLDTAQLIKHSIGLIKNKGNKKAKLIYIYWEPLNAKEFSQYQQHRIELDEFSKLIKCVNGIEFHHTTYLEFYNQFESDKFLKQHLDNFKEKYFFNIEM
ncbi:MAG: hypothetical protein H7239_02430 [Flavobacterium sp.]|nr:hypothetical protein [Flavobacterium sp.]